MTNKAREEALAALEPFARFGEFLESETEGFADLDELELFVPESDVLLTRLYIGAFRRAREAHAALTASPTAPSDEETGKLVEALLADARESERHGGEATARDELIAQAAAHLTTQAEEIARLTGERNAALATARLMEAHAQEALDERKGFHDRATAAEAALMGGEGKDLGASRELHQGSVVDASSGATREAAIDWHQVADTLEDLSAEAANDAMMLVGGPGNRRRQDARDFALWAKAVRRLAGGSEAVQLGASEAKHRDEQNPPNPDLDGLREAVARVIREWSHQFDQVEKLDFGKRVTERTEIAAEAATEILALPAIRNALGGGHDL